MSNHMITDIQFLQQILGDTRRTVICSPENESRVKSHIDARGLSGIITVHVDPHTPDDKIYVIDAQAIEAGLDAGLGVRRGRRHI